MCLEVPNFDAEHCRDPRTKLRRGKPPDMGESIVNILIFCGTPEANPSISWGKPFGKLRYTKMNIEKHMFLIDISTINGTFSIAMLVYQMVYHR